MSDSAILGAYLGVYQASVANNVDPLNEARVTLLVPQILGDAESAWAVPASPTNTIPPVGQTVWVQFSGGDLTKPVYSPLGIKEVQDAVGAIPGTDTLPPKQPTALTLTTQPVIAPDGTTQAQITASWTAPTENQDGTNLTDLAYYVVQYSYDGTSWSGGVSTQDTLVVLDGLHTGVDVTVRVQAVDTSDNGSLWATGDITSGSSTTPPPVPSAPTVVGVLGGLKVTWDGRDSNGFAMPPFFDHIQVQRDTDPAFSNPVTVATLTGADFFYDSIQNYGSSYNYRALAVSKTGFVSAPSTGHSDTPKQAGTGDIAANSVTANQMAAGTITAQSGVIASIDASKVTVGKINATQIDATNLQVAAANVTGQITASQLSATAIDGKTITGATISGGAVTGGTVNASRVWLGDPNGGEIYLEPIVANGISSAEIFFLVHDTSQLDGSRLQSALYRKGQPNAASSFLIKGPVAGDGTGVSQIDASDRPVVEWNSQNADASSNANLHVYMLHNQTGAVTEVLLADKTQFTVTPPLNANGGLMVTGNGSVSGTFTATQQINANGGLAVTGSSSISGASSAVTYSAGTSVQSPVYKDSAGRDIGLGTINITKQPSTVASITNAADVAVMTTSTVTFKANRAYEVMISAFMLTTVAGDVAHFKLKRDSVSGTTIHDWFGSLPMPTANDNYSWFGRKVMIIGSSDVSAVLCFTAVRGAGSGTLTSNTSNTQNPFLEIRDIGAASAYSGFYTFS